MEVIIQPDAAAATQLVARLIAKALRQKPRLVLGLATGRTMEQVYALLTDMHKQEELDFARCRTFNLDEYVGLRPEDNHSYRFYMNHHLFSKVNIDRRNTHLPDGMADDLDAACNQYEHAIRQAGGIDFQLLGIGHDGHIGFNEPLSALRSRTRAKTLTPLTVAANGPLFGDQARMPRRALTMGVGTILDSKRCVLLATGTTKADILARAIEGPITASVSASALQLHPHCTIVVDEETAARLVGKDYYRFIFQNEPKWKEFR